MLGLLVYLIGLIFRTRKMAAWYVWGPPTLSERDLVPKLLGHHPDHSMIHLAYMDDTLIIDLVQRGKKWGPTSFCSVMLPATIRDFFSRINVSIESQVEAILVVNAAVPKAAGCKCYARTMIELGFTNINGKVYNSANEYCNTVTGWKNDQMIGQFPEDMSLRVPSGDSDDNQTQILRRATNLYFYTPQEDSFFA